MFLLESGRMCVLCDKNVTHLSAEFECFGTFKNMRSVFVGTYLCNNT